MERSRLMKTADLYDRYGESPEVTGFRVVMQPFFDYGGITTFAGQIATVRVFEDNVLVKETLATRGKGRVLVVDGGASMRYALVGDILAQMAIDNAWSGIVLAGCIRDAEEIATMPIGVKALGTMPRKSQKRGEGAVGVPVLLGELVVAPGEWLYADRDGIVLSREELSLD